MNLAFSGLTTSRLIIFKSMLDIRSRAFTLQLIKNKLTPCACIIGARFYFQVFLRGMVFYNILRTANFFFLTKHAAGCAFLQSVENGG